MEARFTTNLKAPELTAPELGNPENFLVKIYNFAEKKVKATRGDN
jgi:hypothetical protein